MGTLDCYSAMAHEETILFYRKDSWNTEDALDDKYLEFQMPSSETYFSRLRPLFSFQIKSLVSLNNFSHVLLRDGVLFLLRFFQRFPKPRGLRCRLLVNHRLEQLVPAEWKENILFYRISSETSRSDDFSRQVIHLPLDAIWDEDDFSKEIENLKKQCPGNTRFELLCTQNTLRGEDYLNYCRKDSLAFLLKAQKILGQDSCNLLSLSSFWSGDFNQTRFYKCRSSQIFVSDCFLAHHVLSKGGDVIGIEKRSERNEFIPLSPFHGMEVLTSASNEESVRKILFEEMQFPDGALFDHEPSEMRGLEDFFKVFYYSSDLLKVSRQLNRILP